MYRTFLFISVLFFSLLLAPLAHADECTVIYGGGKIDCNKPTVTPTPTPVQTVSNTKTTTLPTQTKGGLPINKPVPTTTTPATGPEVLGLVSLVPLAAAGMWLRKRSV